jgi:hypothetical protein
MNAMRRKKGSPPKSQPKKMRCCLGFTAKLEAAIPHGELVRTFDGLELPRNLLKRWREGRTVRLDYAWLLAKHLGVSLDSLADDETTYPTARNPDRPAPLIPGIARTSGPLTPDGAGSGRPKKRARNNDISRQH